MGRRSRSQWFSSGPFFGRRSERPTSTRRPKRQLRLEPLEGRRMLAAVVVGNKFDTVNGDTSSIAALIASPGADGVSLREAILAANATAGSDSISFAPAVIGGTIDLGGGQLPTITGDLAIDGRLNFVCRTGSRALVIDVGANTSITGFKITRGDAANGGAIYNAGNLTLTDCILNENVAGDAGGAIYNAVGATLTANRLTADDNLAYGSGGAIANAGVLVVNHSHRGVSEYWGVYPSGENGMGFYRNKSEDRGGAIYNAPTGNVTLTDVSLLKNEASANGGGVFNEGTMTINGIIGSTVIAAAGPHGAPPEQTDYYLYSLAFNLANEGGGVYNTGALTMNGCSVTLNSSLPPGIAGGVVNGGVLNLIGSTLSNNGPNAVVNYNTLTAVNSTFAASASSGVLNYATATVTNSTFSGNGAGLNNAGTLSLNNTVMVGNGGDIVGGGGLTGSHNFIGDGSGVGLTGTISGDPLLGPLTIANGGTTMTRRPLPGSPLLDAGSNSLVPSGVSTDQHGGKRIKNGTVDIGAVEVGAETIIVTTLDDEFNGAPNPGLGSGTSLREAIAFASNVLPVDGATITFAPGLAGTIALVDQSLPDITGNLTIVGPGAGLLAIDASAVGPVAKGGIVKIYSGADVGGQDNVAISGLTFRNGAASSSGGAIHSANSLTLTDCAFVDNSAANGGGAVLGQIALTIIDSSFIGNSVDGDLYRLYGGGAVNFIGDEMTIVGSTFSNNTSRSQGGAILNMGIATVTDSIFTDNSSEFGGGAIYNYNTSDFPDGWGTLTITGSTFTGNSAVFGGALANDHDQSWPDYARMTVINSTLDGNFASQRGGGINNGSILTVLNSTLFGNSAANGASGIDNGRLLGQNERDGNGGVIVNNTIIDSATGIDFAVGADYVGAVVGDHNLISDGSGGLANTISGAALLGPLTNNGGPTMTRAPLLGSPAIDAGAPGAVAGVGDTPLNDQRGGGFARVIGNAIDIGAYERQTPHLAGDFNRDGAVNAADYTLWRDALGGNAPNAYFGADGDGDGVIGQEDNNIWRANYGRTLPAPAPAPVSLSLARTELIATTAEDASSSPAATALSIASVTSAAIATASPLRNEVTDVAHRADQSSVSSDLMWLTVHDLSHRAVSRQAPSAVRLSDKLLHEDAMLTLLSSPYHKEPKYADNSALGWPASKEAARDADSEVGIVDDCFASFSQSLQ